VEDDVAAGRCTFGGCAVENVADDDLDRKPRERRSARNCPHESANIGTALEHEAFDQASSDEARRSRHEDTPAGKGARRFYPPPPSTAA
jgi:hypothetical protein